MIEEEILTRIHNIEHKLDILLSKLRLSDIASDGDMEAAHLVKLPPTLPQEPRPPCPVCNEPIRMVPLQASRQVIQTTPSLMYDAAGNSFFGQKRICGCKITNLKV